MENPGLYLVSYQVSVSEAGQLSLRVNGVPVPYSRAGRATGTSLITNTVLIRTLLAFETIEVINDASAAALTITPLAGGTESVSATLTITQLQ